MVYSNLGGHILRGSVTDRGRFYVQMLHNVTPVLLGIARNQPIRMDLPPKIDERFEVDVVIEDRNRYFPKEGRKYRCWLVVLYWGVSVFADKVTSFEGQTRWYGLGGFR